MSRFAIMYRNGKEKVYEVAFSPSPTWKMLHDLAVSMLEEKGGVAIEFRGPNGLRGFITRRSL